MHLKKPFFNYNGGVSFFYPATTAEDTVDTYGSERHDSVAADGTRFSYYVGPRQFQGFMFRWLSGSDVTSLVSFWETVRDGRIVDIIDDDTIRKCGTGTCGDGYVCGTDEDGNATSRTQWRIESKELVVSAEQVYGYYQVPMQFRRVV